MRGIIIAGALAALAVALGFVTLAMNSSSAHAVSSVMLPHHVLASEKHAAGVKPTAAPKPKVNRFFVAARGAGLPTAIAAGLGKSRVVIVQLTSSSDSIAKLAAEEAKDGAGLAGVPYVQLSVDTSSPAMQQLTRALGAIPTAPATLVYTRPSTVFVTLTGFNDRTTIQQAAANAAAPTAS